MSTEVTQNFKRKKEKQKRVKPFDADVGGFGQVQKKKYLMFFTLVAKSTGRLIKFYFLSIANNWFLSLEKKGKVFSRPHWFFKTEQFISLQKSLLLSSRFSAMNPAQSSLILIGMHSLLRSRDGQWAKTPRGEEEKRKKMGGRRKKKLWDEPNSVIIFTSEMRLMCLAVCACPFVCVRGCLRVCVLSRERRTNRRKNRRTDGRKKRWMDRRTDVLVKMETCLSNKKVKGC